VRITRNVNKDGTAHANFADIIFSGPRIPATKYSQSATEADPNVHGAGVATHLQQLLALSTLGSTSVAGYDVKTAVPTY
jgi:predicted glycosyltransferase